MIARAARRGAIAAVLILAGACSGNGDPSRGGEGAGEEDRVNNEASFETVTFRAADGRTVTGGLAGSGEIGIVLLHGLKFIDGKDSFRDEALYLAKEGIAALAVSLRGYPASSIPPQEKGRDLDARAALSFLAGQGCRRVFVLGSSMGGAIALAASPELARDPAFAGLILMSAGGPGAADRIDRPKLMFAAKDDPQVLERVQAMHATAPEPKRLVVFESGGHGQALFAARRDELFREILAFVRGAP